MKSLFIVVFCVIVSTLSAQVDCYGELRTKGLQLLEKKKYREAMNQFFAARYCPNKPGEDDLDTLIITTQDRWVQELREARLAAQRLAAKADTLQHYLEGEQTYAVFLKEGLEKFKKGKFQEALQNFAIARFTKENKEILGWIAQVWKAMRAEWLTQEGYLDSAFVAYTKIPFLDSSDFRTQRLCQIQTSQLHWRKRVNKDSLSRIDSLDLSGDTLDSSRLYLLPSEIQELTNLNILNLSNNNFSAIPLENWSLLTHLKKLKTLDLSENDLEKMPIEHWQTLAQFPDLLHLNLNYNELSELPTAIFRLETLEKLELRGNHLTELATEIGQLTNLEMLDISDNQLTELPENIGELVNLQNLDLGGNQLTELPLAVSRLFNLEVLDLGTNRLFQIPNSIGQLTKLRMLNLSGNDLYQLSPEIGRLAALETLDLSYNNLSQLPYEHWDFLRKLPRLQKLMLLFNRLTPEDIEYIRQWVPAHCIIKY